MPGTLLLNQFQGDISINGENITLEGTFVIQAENATVIIEDSWYIVKTRFEVEVQPPLLQLLSNKQQRAIHSAVESGYRHFDTAFNHENERQIGEALRTQIQMGNVSRENIVLTTKLWNIHHDPRDVRRICEHQLNLLGFEYIDLYLMQFPVGYRHIDVDYVDTWRAMEELVKLGLVRSIGLSSGKRDSHYRRLLVYCEDTL
ncbi:uncharacterized protein Dwil_GK26800 [Drosophila willistoni]|uniref:NADP-dependent oxidoreductase domain-containing protein n=1 Tax=Drosophila willistoni TaxID=7260 RepID=A0A0Q9WUE6_DROWI|nr:uncharacterized protein Dwil_GK26800 [Drosophila willistoni]